MCTAINVMVHFKPVLFKVTQTYSEKGIRVLKSVSIDFQTPRGGLKKRGVAQVLFFFLTSFEVFRIIV